MRCRNECHHCVNDEHNNNASKWVLGQFCITTDKMLNFSGDFDGHGHGDILGKVPLYYSESENNFFIYLCHQTLNSILYEPIWSDIAFTFSFALI